MEGECQHLIPEDFKLSSQPGITALLVGFAIYFDILLELFLNRFMQGLF